MGTFDDMVRRAARAAAEVAAETIWPTRCALCDAPGAVLCETCARGLPYLDWWRACRRCGSPFGYVQCDACSPVIERQLGCDAPPFEACASAVAFTGATGRIVRVFKDQGEQRLAKVMACMMAHVMPPGWPVDAVTYVPATLAAYRYRGYDHAQLVGFELARLLNTPCVSLLARPHTADQRALTRAERMANLRGSFRLGPAELVGMGRGGIMRSAGPAPPGLRRIVLVDDVYTTGATMHAATQALAAGVADQVRCLTFARV